MLYNKIKIYSIVIITGMMRYFCLFVFLLLAPLANAQNSFQPFVDSLAKVFMKNNNSALAIGIYDNGKEKIFYYGETAPGRNQKPDSNSLFEIGGISETFTSVLFADLTVKGILGMDDKLQDFLPVNVPSPVYQEIVCMKAVETKMPNEYGETENMRITFSPYVCFPDPSTKPQYIILCDLATNTTGLPEYPDNLCRRKNKKDPFAAYTRENLYDFIREFRFDKPLGYDYKHSEVGIALLGHALELKTKTGFDTLIAERLFTPLQMLQTKTKLTPEMKNRLVTGHNKKGKPVPNWNYDIMAPAGGIHSTATDMMKFLAANISVKKDYYTDLLDFTHNPRLKLNSKKEKDTEISLGWKVNSLGVLEKRVVWQEGITGGYSAYIGFVESNHTGVVILSAVSKKANEVGMEILKKLAHQKL